MNPKSFVLSRFPAASASSFIILSRALQDFTNLGGGVSRRYLHTIAHFRLTR